MNFAGIYKPGSSIRFAFRFTNAGAGATGLTPTCEVNSPSGAIAADPTVTELSAARHPGVYVATLPVEDTTVAGNYIATATVGAGADDLNQTCLAVVASEFSDITDAEADIDEIETLVNMLGNGRARDLVNKYSRVGSHQHLDVSSSVVPLAIPGRATAILLQAVTQDIAMTIDGSTPSATNGFRLVAGEQAQVLPLWPNMTLKFIRAGGSDGDVEAQFLQER